MIQVLVHNIRSVENVGAIFRTSEGFGVDKIYLSGCTILAKTELPHLEAKLAQKLTKTALGAEKMVRFERWGDDFKEIQEKILALKDDGFMVVGLENNINKKTINLPDFVGGDKILLVLGEEVNGIGADLMDLIDVFVEIPMLGKKESFNVSVAAGIALYQMTAR